MKTQAAQVIHLDRAFQNHQNQRSTRASKEWSYEYIEEELKKLQTKVKTLEENPAYSETDLFGQIGEGYALKHTIRVTLEIYSDEAIAIIPTLELYGEGFTETEAIADLKLELIDLFEDLNSIPDEKLGKELLAHKKTINGLIERQ